MFESVLLRFLECPNMEVTHLLCPMDASTRALLLQQYYHLDSNVLRLFLANPLSGLRRAVDSVAETTRVELKRFASDLPIPSRKL